MTTPPLQPGQYWRTRAGEIVYVASILPEWMNDPLPVMAVMKNRNSEYEQDWYRLDGGFFEEGESDDDLITHLPECDSLDWAPPAIEYPAYVMPSSGSMHYAYICRHSPTSAEIVYRSGKTEPYEWDDESQGFIDEGTRVYITKEQAESRVKKSDPPKPPSKYHTAPEVYSLIMDANLANNSPSQDNHSSSRPIFLLIRICSAQQSMLSELSAQVDALRSQIANRGGCCGQPD